MVASLNARIAAAERSANYNLNLQRKAEARGDERAAAKYQRRAARKFTEVSRLTHMQKDREDRARMARLRKEGASRKKRGGGFWAWFLGR